MSTIRERLDELTKAVGISTDTELLRRVYKDMRSGGRIPANMDEDSFVKNKKGSFSQMIKGERYFDSELMLSMERVLGASMVYLLDGEGEKMPIELRRGLRYAAYVDTRAAYDSLVDEGVTVYLEHDEFVHCLLDYMIEYNSKNGFDYFMNCDGMVRHAKSLDENSMGLPAQNYSLSSVIEAMVKNCSLKAGLNYFDGFYFVENGIDPTEFDESKAYFMRKAAVELSKREDARNAMCNFKTVSLRDANKSLSSKDNLPKGESIFVNRYMTEMIEGIFGVNESLGGRSILHGIDLLKKAVQINGKAMEAILNLGFEQYRIRDDGYVFSDSILCGSIVYLEPNMVEWLSDAIDVIAECNEYFQQLRDFMSRISEANRVTIYDNTMEIKAQDSKDFYDFYRLMDEKQCGLVPHYDGRLSENNDSFTLPKDSKAFNLSPNNWYKLPEAVRLLSKVDAISEEALGEGRVYSFLDLGVESFLEKAGKVVAFVPTQIKIGGRYDNLARLVSNVCLQTPYFYSVGQYVASFVEVLKQYGLKKGDLEEALSGMKEFYLKSAASRDRKDESQFPLIELDERRALWLDLYFDKIVRQV